MPEESAAAGPDDYMSGLTRLAEKCGRCIGAAGIEAVPDSYREPKMRLMFFVTVRRLTEEAHVPHTKTQPKQGN